MSIVEYLSQPFWQRLGLTLLHFLWQGLAVAVLVGVFIRMLRLKHGNARYGAYLLAFIAMIAWPVVTFTAIDIDISANTEPVTVAEPVEVVDISPSPYTALPSVDVLPEVETIRPAIPASPDSIPLGQRISGWLNVSMPWALVIWMGGVAVLSVRLLMGFVGVYRWRHHLEPLPERLVQRIASLSEGLGMRRFSRVFISPTVVQAMAVGYLRPMVLLPVAMLTQMQPEMLEAVIAHELAHIRRFDLWINLVQRVTETLLFYHPAVWWLSNCLRRERELCCDELAVKATGRRLTYATTLESIGRARFMAKQPVLAAGLGQDKKPTLGRVHHILGLKPAQRNCPFWLAGVITVLFLAALVIPTTLALTNRSDEKINDFESVEAEGGWGEAVEGLEMRVRAERQRWYEGETPKFLVDMRNQGTVEWELGLTQENWEVELDGVWHRVGASFTGGFRTLLFGPGQEHKDIEFCPEVRSEWNIHGKPLKFTPGSHTVRLSFGPSTRDRAYWRRLRVVSNPVVIEVLPKGERDGTVDDEDDASTNLQAELDELWLQRDQGLAAAEAFGKKLLKKYTKRQEKPLIYYQLAEIYAQSEEADPNKIVEFARQGWWYLNDPVKKARLFIYWGDALQLTKGRRDAGKIYLRGLAFCLQYGLPKEKPELPTVSRYTADGPAEEVEKHDKENKRQMAAIKHAKLIGELIEYRQVLTGRVVQLYAPLPDAFDELHELVMRYLGSEQACQQVIAAAKSYRTDHKTAIPLIMRLGGDPNPRADLDWGQETKGIRVRLRADTSSWRVGGVPKFKLDVRNDGSHILLLTSAADCWGVEVDGVWYRVTISMLGGAKGMSFGPDKRWYNLELSLDKAVGPQNENGGFELAPGLHTVRAALASGLSEDGKMLSVGAVSDPVEIEILPTEKKTAVSIEGKEIEKKVNLVWGKEVNGLRAAVEFVPEKGSYEQGEVVGIRFYLQNVSNQIINLSTPRWCIQSRCLAEDQLGIKMPARTIPEPWGMITIDRHKLLPGQVIKLESGSLAIAKDEIQGNRFYKYPVRYVVTLKPGQYSLHYRLSFPGITRLDGDGKVVVPQPDDWQGALETGKRKLVIISNAESDQKPTGRVEVEKENSDQDTKEVFLPDEDISPVALRLASGKLLRIPDVNSVNLASAINELGVDLAYGSNETGNSKGFIFLRGATADKQLVYLKSQNLNVYEIGRDLPEVLVVTTSESARYVVEILSADKYGCRLKYHRLDKPNVPVEGEGAIDEIDAETLIDKVRQSIQPSETMQISWSTETMSLPPTKSAWVVASNENVEDKYVLWRNDYNYIISGVRSRFEYITEVYQNRDDKVPFYSRRLTSVFDGKELHEITEEIKKGNPTYVGRRSYLDDNQRYLFQRVAGFPPDLNRFNQVRIFNEFEFNVLDSGNPGIYLLDAVRKEDGMHWQLSIDGNRNFNNVKTVLFKSDDTGGISRENNVILKQYENGFWYPIQVEHIQYHYDTGEVQRKITVDINVQFDIRIQDDIFKLDFPEGMRVFDVFKGKWVTIEGSDISEHTPVVQVEGTGITAEKESEFSAILPNGVTVELIGMCEYPSVDKQWWQPDGSLLVNPPYDESDIDILSFRKPDAIPIEFAFRLSGNLSEPAWEAKVKREEQAFIWWTGRRSKDGKFLTDIKSIGMFVKSDQKILDLRVGFSLADGPYEWVDFKNISVKPNFTTLPNGVTAEQSATIRVPEDYPTAYEAVKAAKDGDTLVISADRYQGEDPLIEPKLEIEVEKTASNNSVGDLKSHQHITFIEGMSIREALRFLGKAFKKNIIPSEKVAGQVPVNELYDVTFEEALQAILGTHKYIIEGKFIRVYTEEEFESIYTEEKTNSQVEGEGGWGEAAEGVQCRLRADKYRWEAEEKPVFKADIRNRGELELYVHAADEFCQLEIDGEWHGWFGPWGKIDGKQSRLGHGSQINNISISLAKTWVGKKNVLALSAGVHTVRVAFILQRSEREYQNVVRVVSNPVEIEVVSAKAKPVVQVEVKREFELITRPLTKKGIELQLPRIATLQYWNEVFDLDSETISHYEPGARRWPKGADVGFDIDFPQEIKGSVNWGINTGYKTTGHRFLALDSYSFEQAVWETSTKLDELRNSKWMGRGLSKLTLKEFPEFFAVLTDGYSVKADSTVEHASPKLAIIEVVETKDKSAEIKYWLERKTQNKSVMQVEGEGIKTEIQEVVKDFWKAVTTEDWQAVNEYSEMDILKQRAGALEHVLAGVGAERKGLLSRGINISRIDEVYVEGREAIAIGPANGERYQWYYLQKRGDVWVIKLFDDAPPRMSVQDVFFKCRSVDKLMLMGKGLTKYAAEHQGKLPENLEALEPYIPDKSLRAWLRQHVEYLGKGKKMEKTPNSTIAYTKTLVSKDENISVLFNDGIVDFVRTSQVERDI